jgi:hypothetical protein
LVTSPIHEGRFTFESYGFRVSLESGNSVLLRKAVQIAQKALLGRLTFIENPSGNFGYRFGFDLKNGIFHLFQNGELTNHSDSEYILFKYFNAVLRVTVAENAVDTVFVHAGVVGLNSKAVIFPGRSFRGKTTLVKALIELGAVYYSDEYAVIGIDGRVSPYPRDLSLRSYFVEYDEVEVPAAEFGATIAESPAGIGAVVITEFEEHSVWEPQKLTVGEGILETIPHTIPIKADTEMSLKILNLAYSNAIIAKSNRGDVKRDAVQILSFLDKHLN